MTRPLIQQSIENLEKLFAANPANPNVLEMLRAELDHRQTRRARMLREQVAQLLNLVRRPSSAAVEQPPLAPVADPIDARAPLPSRDEVVPPTPKPESGALKRSVSILNAWKALEVLAPQGYNRPEDLAGPSDVARLRDGALPWEGAGEKSRPHKRLYYQVPLGELLLAPAYEALLRRFADDAPDRPGTKKLGMLALVVCDQKGVPQTDTVSVSSFAWGLPIALSGNLSSLGSWSKQEERLKEALEKKLIQRDEVGNVLPLTRRGLRDAYDWLVGVLQLSAELVQPASFAIRAYQYRFDRNPPEPLLLNSFFLSDLERARTLFAQGDAPISLQRYLGTVEPSARRDLLRDSRVLQDLLAPARTPPARWPSPGRSPLVALQQTAVNAAVSSVPGSIVAVNGPPGTGKTTLLRDIVAAVVTARAEVLASFDDPEKAFTRSGMAFSSSKAKFELRSLDPKLRGFEMVVASSNNKAVENVSAELPGLRAIAQDASELRYFASVASALRKEECWGLVAAVLGNKGNVYEFQQTFWKDDDRGLETYLAVAAGTPRQIVDETGQGRTPEVVLKENPPNGRPEAMTRWRAARKQFRQALEASRAQSAALQRIHELEEQLPVRRERLEGLLEQLPAFDELCAAAEQALEAAEFEARAAAKIKEQVEHAYLELSTRRPAFMARLLRTQAARCWAEEDRKSVAALESATRLAQSAAANQQGASRRHLEVSQRRREAGDRASQESRALAESEKCLAELLPTLGAPSGGQLVSAPHAQKQQSTAWFDPGAQRLRDDLFAAAMALHKAFIDAAAEPIRHNLAGLARQLWTGVPGATPEIVRDLWASFCLVVPLFSSTFASIGKLFRPLETSSFGWLLLDESGQATPQAAVGAVFRAERVVVVGDPMQVEPVVTIPQTLTRCICSHFSIEADDFGAPAASVQTLADRASPLTATFETQEGARTVGIPLLVHRRCAGPMFGISNSVAYDNLMVKATPLRDSAIGAVLGQSRWFHVEGTAKGHWSPEEGQVVLELLHHLATARVTPELYIVSPFRMVAQELRELVGRTPGLRSWLADPWAFAKERIGTVHTVQGREAEAVLFVLGAPDPTQQFARSWAGSTPNLLNVAVTRAKERLYVIGNRGLWRTAGCFRLLDERLSQPDTGMQTRIG